MVCHVTIGNWPLIISGLIIFLIKGLVTPIDYRLYFSENHFIEEIFKFFLPIFTILSDIEESIIRFLDFYIFRVQR